MSVDSTRTNDAPLLTAAVGFASILALPVVLILVFNVWGDSLPRQVVAGIGLLAMLAFTVIRRKFDALLLAVALFSQFSVSLHSFALQEPVLLQVYFSDVLLILLFWAGVERGQSWRLDGLGWLFLVFLSWLGVATYFSAHQHQSLIFMLWQLKYLLLYICVRNAAWSASTVRYLLFIIASILVLQTAISLAQLWRGNWLGLSIIGEPSVENLKEYLVKGNLRVSGTLGVTNGYGGYVAALLIVLVPFALTRVNWLLAAGMAFGVVSLIACLSRAAWLSFVIGGGAVPLILLHARLVSISRMFLLGLLGVLVLGAGVGAYYAKIANRFEDRQALSSAQGRLSQFTEAWQVMEKHRWVGIGPGVTEFFGRWNQHRRFIRHSLPGVEMGNQVHSSQLQIGIESGFVGLGLFMALIGATGWSVLRSTRRSGYEPVDMTLLRVGAAAGAFSLLVDSSFGTEINHHQFFLLFWLLIGVARSQPAPAREPAAVTIDPAADALLHARLVT